MLKLRQPLSRAQGVLAREQVGHAGTIDLDNDHGP